MPDTLATSFKACRWRRRTPTRAAHRRRRSRTRSSSISPTRPWAAAQSNLVAQALGRPLEDAVFLHATRGVGPLAGQHQVIGSLVRELGQQGDDAGDAEVTGKLAECLDGFNFFDDGWSHLTAFPVHRSLPE